MLLGGLLVDVFLICVEHQSCQEQKFTMLVIKKNLRVSERFPYPVRVEAVLEVIDQFPMRKLEKMTRKGSHLRFHYLTFIFMWYDDHASFSAVHREMFVLFSINNSFSSTYTVQGHRGLEPIPAVMEWQPGYTLDMLPVYYRASRESQTTIYSDMHIYGQVNITN